MKFALKTLVAAATLAVAATSHSAIVTANLGQQIIVSDPAGSGRQTELYLSSGGGALSFSTGSEYVPGDVNSIGGLIGALNVGRVAISGVGGATVQETTLPDPFDEADVRVGSVATASVVGLSIDNQSGQIDSVASTGGAQQVGSRISGTLTGGTATVTNLRFDLVNKLVYADLAGTKAAVGTSPAVNYNLPDTVLWTIGNITGPTAIPVAALLSANPRTGLEAAGFTYLDEQTFSAVNVISGLKITDTGFAFFRDSLGLLSTGVNALRAVNDDPQGWGTVTSTLVFTTAVPEAGTWAMMGMGLATVGLAVRMNRRRTQYPR